MFLVRPSEEFPALVEQYREYCEENDLQYLEANFRNFVNFFHSLDISIRVGDRGEQFLSEAINYRADPGQNYHLSSVTEDRQQAEYDAVYLGFRLLDQFEE